MRMALLIMFLSGTLCLETVQAQSQPAKPAEAAQRDRQIGLNTRWITSSEVDTVLQADGKSWTSLKEADVYVRSLGVAETDKILAIAAHDKSASMVTTPRLTLFEHQQASIILHTEQAYVADYHETVDAFHGDTKTVPVGFDIECQGTIDPVKGSVALNFHAHIVKFLEMSTQPWAGAPASRKDLVIQVPHLAAYDLRAEPTLKDKQTAVYWLKPKYSPFAPARPLAPQFLLITAEILDHVDHHSPADTEPEL